MIWLLALAALAADPCDLPLEAPPEMVSVAWISPTRAKAGNNEWLFVVPTKDLTRWLRDNPGASTGDLLRRVGARRKTSEPKRSYKVTIFEVESVALCRPIEGAAETDVIEGVIACQGGLGRATRNYGGCGRATDFNTGALGPTVYRARWRDLARQGFCLLPAERFVAEGAR